MANLLGALDMIMSGPTEVVVTGDRPDLLEVAASRYHPNSGVVGGERVAGPAWDGREDGLAYVCRNFACQAPVDSPNALAAQLNGS